MTTFYERFVSDMFLIAPEDVFDYTNDFGVTHAAMGLAGEAGEVVDLIKKHVFTGKPLDRDDIINEMGDVEFYLEALRQELDITREEVVLANWKKLSQRHGDNDNIRDHYAKQ